MAVTKLVKNGIYSPFLGFWGSFEAYALLAFRIMPLHSKRAMCSLNVLWENPLSAGSAELPWFTIPRPGKICL